MKRMVRVWDENTNAMDKLGVGLVWVGDGLHEDGYEGQIYDHCGGKESGIQFSGM